MSCLAASERNIICLPNQWQGIEMVTMDMGGYSTKVSNIITDTAPGNETETQSQSIRDSGRDMQELTKIGELIIGKVSFVIHFPLVPYQ
jgi:hypothetical protein